MIIRYVKSLMLVMLVGAGIAPWVNAAEPVAAINTEQGIAIKGYDPVAYFDQKIPMQGNPAFSTTWHGVTYHFASAAHRDLFVAAPEKYAPQYGGYCSYAMSLNLIADASPQSWAVVDGKLYLNNNKIAHGLWSQNKSGNIVKADHNWPDYPKLGDADIAADHSAANQ